MLRGDEGRYLKKGNFMVCTIESVLGSDPQKMMAAQAPCQCHTDPILNRYRDIGAGHSGDASFAHSVGVASNQITNYSGNEFLSKFFFWDVFAGAQETKHKGLLHKAFEMVAHDLKRMHKEGIKIGDVVFFAATLGIKGDLKFHHQMGNLSRSYYNVGTKVNHPICSLCLAGRSGVDFEMFLPARHHVSRAALATRPSAIFGLRGSVSE